MTQGLYNVNNLPSLFWINWDGTLQEGTHNQLSGTANINGNCSAINGILREDLRGYVSEHLQGDITGLYGDCTNVHGNIDNCNLTQEEREAGVDITTLVLEPTL